MTSLLGGMTPARFLRERWQKKPLLIRQAMPGFRGIIGRDAFLRLGTRADARARLVIHHPERKRDAWERHDGPFGGLDAAMLPARAWTLLVNSVESLVPGGWDVLNAFSFIPAARVDDLMVSYAADGGSVGPHDDLYDVFLLQGPGRRRWQISAQADRTLDPHAAIKVLRDFRPQEEWLLGPGDMLYLPPGVAHHGVAEGACFTYSIGFLAPSRAELVESFLGYLGAARAANVADDARYEDPELGVPKDPLQLGDAMVAKVARAIGRIRWSPDDVADFLGRYLTRPKPRMVFRRPARPLALDAFAGRLRRGRVTLALPARGLLRGGRVYLNGDGWDPPRATRPFFRELLGSRAAATAPRDPRTQEILHAWYTAGWIDVR